MQTQKVTSKVVIVNAATHTEMKKRGWLVLVKLNGFPTVGQFYDDKARADEVAKVARERPIPEGAELCLIGDKWCPMTNCNSMFD